MGSTPDKGPQRAGARSPTACSLHSTQAHACQSYLFLVGVISAGLFSGRTAGFPPGMAPLLPMRGTISLVWAFMARTRSQHRCLG